MVVRLNSVVAVVLVIAWNSASAFGRWFAVYVQDNCSRRCNHVTHASALRSGSKLFVDQVPVFSRGFSLATSEFSGRETVIWCPTASLYDLRRRTHNVSHVVLSPISRACS